MSNNDNKTEMRPDSVMKSMNCKKIVIDEDVFARIISMEQARVIRTSGQMAVAVINFKSLVCREIGNSLTGKLECIGKSLKELRNKIREGDSIGWIKKNEELGILFTDIKSNGEKTIEIKIYDYFKDIITSENPQCLHIKLIKFPEENYYKKSGDVKNLETLKKKTAYETAIKRFIDIVGGLIGLMLFLPVSTIIILLIKLTSPGPAIFKQIRIGLNGKYFQILKFRTMYTNKPDDIHRKYVSQLIKGECTDTTYKIIEDPRVTNVGSILRKFSLDEIPQFFNVLKGEMSLVGPRPPLPYEFEQYQLWHKERVYCIKPGLTGLWQVEGRSMTTFDDMVRLDLKYKRSYTLLLDLKIICKTIVVLFTTKGGY